MNQMTEYLPYLFPVYFAALWFFILWILSLTSGWRRLASRYHHPQDFQGDFLRFQSARMNWVNFSSVLNLGLNERGLYLAPMALFRPFHKPLFIPWEEIIAQPSKISLVQGYQLQFRSAPGVHLKLYQRTFQIILDYLRKYTGFRFDDSLDRGDFRR